MKNQKSLIGLRYTVYSKIKILIKTKSPPYYKSSSLSFGEGWGEEIGMSLIAEFLSCEWRAMSLHSAQSKIVDRQSLIVSNSGMRE
jgi:hypothetical protein